MRLAGGRFAAIRFRDGGFRVFIGGAERIPGRALSRLAAGRASPHFPARGATLLTLRWQQRARKVAPREESHSPAHA
jgi:hypothetical protein